jgi:parvulin-like peptidyl-prolyl isomerase
MHRSRRLFGLFAICVAALVACTPGSDVAARVGDVDITHEQVGSRADLLRFLGGLSQQPCGTPVDGETAAAACARFALGNLVQAEVVDGFARANGIEVDPQAVRDAIAGFESSLPSPDDLDQQLAAAGVAREDLRDLATDALLGQDVARALRERIDEDVLRREYDSRPLEFATVELQHILVGSEVEANDVYDKVTAPGATERTFSDLAREVSTDTGSAQNGGAYGTAPLSDYTPEFARAAAALDPGEISRPVQTEFGWHVIRLIDEQVTPFSQARERILQDVAAREFQGWFRERVKALGIEVNPRYGRFDRQTLQVEAVRSTDPEAERAAPTGTTGASAAP